MFKKYEYIFIDATRIVDILLILISFFVALDFRNSEFFQTYISSLLLAWFQWPMQTKVNFSDISVAPWFILPIWTVLLSYFGCNNFERTTGFLKHFLNMVNVHLLGGFLVGSIVYFFKLEDFKRSFFLIFIVVSFFLLFLFRAVIRYFLNYIRLRGQNYNRSVIVGESAEAQQLVSELNTHSHWGYKIEGIITKKGELPSPEELHDFKVLGSLDNLEKILRSMPVDDVFVAVPSEWRLNIKEVLRTCELIGVTVHLLPDRIDMEIAKSTLSSFGDLSLISFSSTPSNPIHLAIKRVIDVVVSLVLLPFFLLLYIVVGTMIKLDSPGPIIYSSTRITRARRPFTFYKFRSMRSDADANIDLLDEQNTLSGPIRKSKSDPRVTKIGKFIRAYSIDEFPQIINVLKGDMSLVGPRPPTPDEVEKYSYEQLRKLSMKQGMTGLWQVSGRDEVIDFDERLKLDLHYIDNWSLSLDFKILLKTFVVVFKKAA